MSPINDILVEKASIEETDKAAKVSINQQVLNAKKSPNQTTNDPAFTSKSQQSQLENPLTAPRMIKDSNQNSIDNRFFAQSLNLVMANSESKPQDSN